MASRTSGGGPAENTQVGNYRIGSEIGRGSFAVVFKGHHTKNKSVAAIKVVQRAKLNRKLLENLESEIQILKKLNHPHIVALTDCKKTDKYIHLIMEYCSVGDLSHIIKKRDRLGTIHPCLEPMVQDYPPIPGSGLHEVVVRHFLKQLASALEYLRKDGLVHRDVKPQNLLLDPPPGWDGHIPEQQFPLEGSRALVGLPSLPILKLADFGFARVLPATSMAETLCGSPLYMAPEILRYEKYDATADLWSVGTVLYEMIVGKPPFRAPNHVDLLRKIESRNDKIDFPSGCLASDDIRGLVRSLLKRNPLERMSFQEFFDHPVVRGEIPGAAVSAQAPVPEMVRPRSSLAAIKTEALPMRRSPSLRTPRDEKVLGVEREGGRSAPDYHTHHIPASPRARTAVESSALPFANVHPPSGTPPRLVERRFTTQVSSPTPPSPAFERPLSRPSLLNHATAPARQEIVQDRKFAVPMDRVQSRGTDPSPGNSLLVQQREREPIRDRHSQRTPSSRDMRPVEEERAEKEDYVFIDKQYVQVNSFADELAIRGTGRTTPSPSSSALSRRALGGHQASPSRAIAVTNRRPEVQAHSKASYERRYGSSPGSARSALAKALEIANLRLFGVSVSPPSQSPPNMQSGYPQNPNPGSMVMISNAGGISEDDMIAIQTIEDAASRSDVVYSFAEVKYAQLVPSAPSAPRGLGLLPSTGSTGELAFGGESSQGSDMQLTTDAVVQLAEEALVLYVKALTLLAKAMDIASNWWSASNSRTGSMSPAAQVASNRINSVVQWVRERFNEVLEKAEFVRIKLIDAQKELPRSHPSHPRNYPENDETSMGVGMENVVVTPGVTAEKLMYDRALEMSSAAAVNELVGDDLNGCEVAYVTSIRMLEAVLERDSSDSEVDGGQMEEEDRRLVEKYMEGIRIRLRCLKKKAAMVMSKRSSGIHSIHSNHGSPHLPSMSPVMMGVSPK